MPAEQLYINIVQPDIVWEHKEENLRQYENYINSIREKREVVILPEMFSTGFSMNPEKLAETMEGPSVKWIGAMAAKYRCTNSVSANYIALVFYSSCLKQCFPGQAPAFRPVGYINQHIIFRFFTIIIFPWRLPCPNRETEIITDHQVEPPSLYTGN